MKILHKIAKFHTQIILVFTLIVVIIFSHISYNKNYNRSVEILNSISEEIFIKGKICSYPVVRENYVSFIMDVESSSKDFLKGEKIYISLTDIPKGAYIPEYTDTVSLKDIISHQSSNANPGSFNYDEYLKGMDIIAKTSLKYKDAVIDISPASFEKDIYRIRCNFTKNTEKYFTAGTGGLVCAIISGERSGISAEDRNALKISGIYHIVAISGLHLNLFVFSVGFFISKLKIKRLKKAFISLIATALVGIFVLMFTGYGLSVYRAFIMMIVFSVSVIVSRDYNPKFSLFASGFIILTLMPYSLWNTGFLLSFLSTLGILYTIDILRYVSTETKLKTISSNYVAKTVLTSFITILFTLPVTVSSFGYITVYSWITNMLVLPFVPYFLALSAVFAFLSAVGLDFFAKIISYSATVFAEYILGVSHYVSSLPYACLEVTVEIVCFAVFYASSFALSLYTAIKKGLKYSFLIILIFVIALGAFLRYNNSENIKITYLDAGQGECILIETSDATIMSDCGTSEFSAAYTADSILDTLASKGIDEIDIMIISHYHYDHSNMISYIAPVCKIKKLLVPKYYNMLDEEAKTYKNIIFETATRENIKIDYVCERSEISFKDSTSIKFLSPKEDMFFDNNNMSLVMKMTYGKNSFLFCGDIETDAMKNLMSEDINCDVLKVAHHGGYCDMAEEFIIKSSPSYAIISCGKNNPFSHPRKEIIEALKKSGAGIYRTDIHGAVTVLADKDKIIRIDTMK